MRPGDRSTPAARRFRSRARRGRWRRAVPLLVAVALLALGAGGWYVLADSSALGVRTVRVTGTRTVAADAVRAAAAVPRGEPLLRLDAGAVRARILSGLPVVQSVQVMRTWPWTVRLVVRERVAVATAAQGGRWVLLDRAGVAYRTVAHPPAGVVEIRSASGAGAAGRRGALLVVAGLPSDLRTLLRVVSVVGPGDIRLLLRDHRTVLWGDPSAGARKATVLRTLLRRPGRVYDVSSPDLVLVR